MRITLDLDDDVAALIAKIRKVKNVSLKEVVNEALRDGLVRILQPTLPSKKFHTDVHFAGRCYLPNLDNTAEVLVIAEGEQHR